MQMKKIGSDNDRLWVRFTPQAHKNIEKVNEKNENLNQGEGREGRTDPLRRKSDVRVHVRAHTVDGLMP